MLETVAARTNLIGAIEKARNSTVLAYVLHEQAMIVDDGVGQLYDKLDALGHRDRLDLFLVSRGGFSEACWRVLTRRISRNALALHIQGDDAEERISRIVEMLNGGLYSPAYPVARAEAADLGLPVVRPPAKLWHDMSALHGLYQQLLHRDLPE